MVLMLAKPTKYSSAIQYHTQQITDKDSRTKGPASIFVGVCSSTGSPPLLFLKYCPDLIHFQGEQRVEEAEETAKKDLFNFKKPVSSLRLLRSDTYQSDTARDSPEYDAIIFLALFLSERSFCFKSYRGLSEKRVTIFLLKCKECKSKTQNMRGAASFEKEDRISH